MKPYYQDEYATLFLGDCRDVLPGLSRDGAAVITDPPYGIEYATAKGRGEIKGYASWSHKQIANDSDTACRDWVIAWADELPAAQAALLRCLCGNPWRPVQHVASRQTVGDGPFAEEVTITLPGIDPRWLTPTVLAIAERAYADRCPADSLAVLADCLEEAGCDDRGILWHLRADSKGGDYGTVGIVNQPVLHARGCWAVDLILGKE